MSVRALHCRPHDIHVSADDHHFHFSAPPYILHLRFEHAVLLPEPHPLEKNPLPHTTYDFDTGIAQINMVKSVSAEFKKLDLFSPLMVDTPDVASPKSPSRGIQNLASLSHDPLSQTQETLFISDINTEFATQTAKVSDLQIPLRELSLTRPTYGFASRYEAVFAVRGDDTSQIVQLPHPDTTPVWRRPSLRKAAEDKQFSIEHYITDYFLFEGFTHVLEYSPGLRMPVPQSDNPLPKRQYPSNVDSAATSDLAGILFAACFDERATVGERTVESTWTVSRLSPSLAFLEQMKSPREAVLAAYRRSLIYPLYRNCEFADLVLRDLKRIFEYPVKYLRRKLYNILMELRDLFEADPLLRLFCDLFFIDYCIWIQDVDDNVLEKLASDIKEIKIEKNELELRLVELEKRATVMPLGRGGFWRSPTPRLPPEESTSSNGHSSDATHSTLSY